MPSPLALHLADRFAADARALRGRAEGLRTRPVRGGPDAAAYLRMAGACDRVRAFFAEAAEGADDDEALRGLLPQVEALVAGARSADERNVYAGAGARLREGLDRDEDDADDDADVDDEDEDEDEE